MSISTLTLLCLTAVSSAAGAAGEVRFKDQAWEELLHRVPGILATYDSHTGRFGRGIWICNDQQEMYPLAVAYAMKRPGNKFFKDRQLLETITHAGEALIADADEKGQWEFRKKDGSTWGKILMPWTYSRWIRTYGLIRDDMPAERRAGWDKALRLGYEWISKKALHSQHNIPTHHAMGLYIAGQVLDRPDWSRQAADFIRRIAQAQSEGGYWSEGGGPVVVYNGVYVEALGVYCAASGDEQVRPALERAAAYHYHFTYPDGSSVETIDQRNAYHHTPVPGNVGFSCSAIGRTHLQQQLARTKNAWGADLCASLILYGQEGPIAPVDKQQPTFVLSERGVERAATLRDGPWFVCLSAFTAPVANNRWHQDRQSLVSVFHQRTGLILGGGNTKLQPAWSTFTVGDTSLLSHRAGDENPRFLPKGKLFHVPTAAKLVDDPQLGLELDYGPQRCRVSVEPLDGQRLAFEVSANPQADLPVIAHLTLLPKLGKTLQTAAGTKVTLGEQSLNLDAAQIGDWIEHAGWRIHVPRTARLVWPRLPHNPYAKDGHAALADARLELALPFSASAVTHRVVLEIRR